MSRLLEVRGLRVTFPGGAEALRGVDLTLERGESVAVVGESGAGKSTLALCLGGLLQPPDASGSVTIDGQQLLGADPEVLRRLRWDTVAVSLQGAPFNPVATIGTQIAELFTVHRGVGKAEARQEAGRAAADLDLDPALLGRYPHQLSGGQQRLALLAMTLALDPDLVVLDEPTAGLDLHTKRELVARLSAATERGFALVVMTHDLSDASRLADRTVVLYAGEAMEAGDTGKVLGDPAHPYTWALTGAYPVMSTTKDLRPIRGAAPDPRAVPSGCPFHPRCTQAEEICRTQRVALEPSRGRLVACHPGGVRMLLSADRLAKRFDVPEGSVTALDGVSLTVRHGEALGVVGPSGSGKTTLARILAGHLAPDTGTVVVGDRPLSTSWGAEARALRRRIQLVAQDPWDAVSPRLTVADLVAEPLVVWGRPADTDRRVAEMLAAVGLPSDGPFLEARIEQLSGGQLQRIVLARALILGPDLLVADEPTAMLDASEQARLLVLLRELQVEHGLGLVFVSHDISVVRKVTDRMLVLDAGRVAEQGGSHVVSTRPASEVTRRLIAAAPAFDLDEDAPAGDGTAAADPQVRSTGDRSR